MAKLTHPQAAFWCGVTAAMIALGAIAVRGQDASTTRPANLALRKPTTASSSENNHLPPDANDGNATTRWCAAAGTVPQWWKVDLGQARDLGACSLTWESDGKVYKYIVEGSADDKEWKTLSDQKNTTSKSKTQDLSFDASGKGIRYVRITVTGLEDRVWASITEFSVSAK